MITEVTETIYRGPRPKDLRELAPFEIDSVIDLESGVYEMLHDVPQFPEDFKMAYYHMPCSDVTPPRREFVEKCLALMETPRRIFIHCLSGVDRTGFVVAAYRMRVQGWTFEKATAEWESMGRHPWYFWWTGELKTYVRN